MLRGPGLPTWFLGGFQDYTWISEHFPFFWGPAVPTSSVQTATHQPATMRVPLMRYPKMQYVGMELLTCGRGTESSRVPPDFYCPLGQLSHEQAHKGVGGGKLGLGEGHFGGD